MARSYIAGPGEMSIPFPGDEKPTVIPVGSARRAVGRGAKGSLGRRWLWIRASGAVGLRGQAVFGSSDRLE